MKFGDIYTNGINYWMVVNVTPPCGCGVYRGSHELRPVVLDKDGNPSHFVGHYSGKVSDIKPAATLYRRLHWSV